MSGNAAFLASLSSNHWRTLNRDDLTRVMLWVDSDGCTGVIDVFLKCCVIHDYFYATHENFDGSPITRSEADLIFWQCMGRKSVFGRASPMAAWRWVGVRLLGGKAWK